MKDQLNLWRRVIQNVAKLESKSKKWQTAIFKKVSIYPFNYFIQLNIQQLKSSLINRGFSSTLSSTTVAQLSKQIKKYMTNTTNTNITSGNEIENNDLVYFLRTKWFDLPSNKKEGEYRYYHAKTPLYERERIFPNLLEARGWKRATEPNAPEIERVDNEAMNRLRIRRGKQPLPLIHSKSDRAWLPVQFVYLDFRWGKNYIFSPLVWDSACQNRLLNKDIFMDKAVSYKELYQLEESKKYLNLQFTLKSGLNNINNKTELERAGFLLNSKISSWILKPVGGVGGGFGVKLFRSTPNDLEKAASHMSRFKTVKWWVLQQFVDKPMTIGIQTKTIKSQLGGNKRNRNKRGKRKNKTNIKKVQMVATSSTTINKSLSAIKEHKFHLRIYLMVYWVGNRLSLTIYKKGFLYIASKPYPKNGLPTDTKEYITNCSAGGIGGKFPEDLENKIGKERVDKIFDQIIEIGRSMGKRSLSKMKKPKWLNQTGSAYTIFGLDILVEENDNIDNYNMKDRAIFLESNILLGFDWWGSKFKQRIPKWYRKFKYELQNDMLKLVVDPIFPPIKDYTADSSLTKIGKDLDLDLEHNNFIIPPIVSINR